MKSSRHSRHPHLIAFSILFALSLVFMYSTLYLTQDGINIGSKLWSDFAAHLPLIRSFSLGSNLPPEYPTFPGEPIRYHFLFYFLVGVAEKLGLHFVHGINVLSALGFAWLLFMIYLITRRLASHFSAALLAIFLILFNGSLTFIEFFKKFPLSPQSLSDIFHNPHFVSFGPWSGKPIAAFWNLNIYTNQRHLSLGFAIALSLIYLMLLRLPKRSSLPWFFWPLLIMAFLLPWLHQAAALCALIVMAVIVITHPHSVKRTFIPFTLITLALLPGLAHFASLSGPSLLFELGFLAQPKTFSNIVNYWWQNLGFYLPLLPVLFILGKPTERILLLSGTALFTLANLFRFSTDMINNHKLVNFFMILVVIVTAAIITRIWNQSRWQKPLLAILVFFLTFSGIIDLFPIVNDSRMNLPDIPQNPPAAWIAKNTPTSAVFLTTTYLYHPAHLAGRKTYLDYGYFNWSMGYNDSARRQTLEVLFSPLINPDHLCQALIDSGITHVTIHPGPAEFAPGVDPHQSTLERVFTPQISFPETGAIYNVAANCKETYVN